MRYFIIIITLCLIRCSTKKTDWFFVKEIPLDSIAPVGLAFQDEELIVSDGDENRLIYLTKEGGLLKQLKGLNRPMHISCSLEGVLVPTYGDDKVRLVKKGKIEKVTIPFDLDSPAGVDSYKNQLAVADFYHHRVLWYNGVKWVEIGSKGDREGEFHYPTDIQITEDRLYVADAYNHRVQVFDKEGEFLSMFGKSEKMNASTGIYYFDTQVFVTDFEQSRLLIYNRNGDLEQIIFNHLNKPIDALVIGESLYVVNYKGKSISIFKR